MSDEVSLEHQYGEGITQLLQDHLIANPKVFVLDTDTEQMYEVYREATENGMYGRCNLTLVPTGMMDEVPVDTFVSMFITRNLTSKPSNRDIIESLLGYLKYTKVTIKDPTPTLRSLINTLTYIKAAGSNVIFNKYGVEVSTIPSCPHFKDIPDQDVEYVASRIIVDYVNDPTSVKDIAIFVYVLERVIVESVKPPKCFK